MIAQAKAAEPAAAPEQKSGLNSFVLRIMTAKSFAMRILRGISR
jgi:hypothetical protein